ncbi:MAG TPA: SDR family oxidoreductase [Solirubrobacterales bacterium]|jgi:NAD(P)-dependent dehydrogenase (short-subunit alcohol dehydrogenase family)
MKLDGKVSIVTGGAAGIGRATAEAMIAEGSEVVLWDLSDGVEDVAREIGASGRRVDVTDPAQVREAADASPDACALVNCAGVATADGSFAPVFEIPDAGWDSVIAANLTGTFLPLREVSRNMVAGKLPGRIVNIGSGASIAADPEQVCYNVAKAAILMLTKASALDLAPYGVLVNCISPGPTRTALATEGAGGANPEIEKLFMRVPSHRWCAPEEVAEAILFMVHNDWTTGENLQFDGGYSIIGPFYWDRYRAGFDEAEWRTPTVE